MRLDQVIPYIAGVLVTLGLKESADVFKSNHVPSYLLDRSFSISLGAIQGQSANQMTHQFNVPLDVNVYFKGARDMTGQRQQCLQTAQDILQRVLSPQVRLGPGVKDIRPRSITIDPLNTSNDNAAILSLGLDVITIFAFTNS